jgi:hypothetical protein
MRFSSLVGGLTAIGGVALATTVESDNFNVVSALQDLGVDVARIPALESFSESQSWSTETACSIAVSETHLCII